MKREATLLAEDFRQKETKSKEDQASVHDEVWFFLTFYVLFS